MQPISGQLLLFSIDNVDIMADHILTVQLYAEQCGLNFNMYHLACRRPIIREDVQVLGYAICIVINRLAL